MRPKPARRATWRRHRPGTISRGLATKAVPLILVGSLAGGIGAMTSSSPLASASPTNAVHLADLLRPTALPAASTVGAAATTPGNVAAFGAVSSMGGPGPAAAGRSVGLAPTPDDQGYWVTAADGGIFAYGDASYLGSMGGQHLNSPIVGITATPDGRGYWLVAADGGIFAYGDASYHGSMGGQHLNSPIVGIAATSTDGYWMVAADGGIFAFGDAGFHGSLPSIGEASSSVTGIAATATGAGYWMVEGDGSIYAFGDATYAGAPPVEPASTEVVGVAAAHQGTGYWETTSTPAAPAAAAPSGTPLGSFVVTCYDLGGHTATGVTTNAATVAVDPSVIPLGATINIDGVGSRVAQDTGSAIKGRRLDIWEPSGAQCSAWGVQTRTVTRTG